jgi:phosphotriesterase-related protein
MRTINTVAGPITADQLGVTLPHEHLFANGTRMIPRDGFSTIWAERADDIARFLAAGGSTLVDLSCGELTNHAAPVLWDTDPEHQLQNRTTGSRSIVNVLATRALAEATGVQVVLGTGHYYDAYMDHDWMDQTSTSRIADYLVADLVDEIPGTGVRAGVIGEIASDFAHITPREEKSFRAAARASRETGALVSTHAPTFAVGLAQIELLVDDEGLDPTRLAIGHTDTVKSVEYSLALARRGVFVQYDCMMACKIGGQLVPTELRRRVEHLKILIDAGFASQLLLSHDVFQRSHQAALGGPGFVFLFEEFADHAEAAGIPRETLHRIHTENARRALFGE